MNKPIDLDQLSGVQQLGYAYRYSCTEETTKVLSTWERNFLVNVLHQHRLKDFISEKQEAIIRKIFKKLRAEVTEERLLGESPAPKQEIPVDIPVQMQANHTLYGEAPAAFRRNATKITDDDIPS